MRHTDRSQPTALCLPCLRNRVDITEGLQRQCVLSVCPKPPNHWVTAEPESKELLALCLKRIRGLNKVRLVDAGFVWTEPHSRRLRVRVTVQAEVLNGAIAEQTCEIEFTLQSHQCDHCNRSAARDYWRALAPSARLHRRSSAARAQRPGLFLWPNAKTPNELADFLAAHSPSRCSKPLRRWCRTTHTPNVFKLQQQHAAAGGGGSRFLSADVWLLTDADLSSDEVHCRSHLGRLLSCGDTARGLDLRRGQSEPRPNWTAWWTRKCQTLSYRRSQRRCLRLRRLEEADVDVDDDDSGGRAARPTRSSWTTWRRTRTPAARVNIYKERLAAAAASAAVSAGDDGAPEIGLDEMLDELNLDADDAAME
uniref:60S ribosomal export protein NMD3 n=1 Tax=Macrostomum lignano TaxID=282301 RepID=A0A1I8FFL8_9PLAT